MSSILKNIYATITDHVQMVGYREIVKAHGRARGLTGLVFNDVDGSMIMARFDKGIKILAEHTRLLNENNSFLYEMNNKLDMLDRVLNKLDTLPERIAEAMK